MVIAKRVIKISEESIMLPSDNLVVDHVSTKFSKLVGVGGGHLVIDFGKLRLTLVKNQTCHEVFRHRQLDID